VGRKPPQINPARDYPAIFAAMAMQALITREGSPADMVAKQTVAYADALINASPQ
jgi:hypothetical protein